MADQTEDNRKFDPNSLGSRMVARPLLEMMDLLENKEADPNEIKNAFAKLDVPKGLLPVVIDLNFKFVGGLDAAKENVKALLKRRGAKEGASDGQSIHHRKTKLSNQHVFATLTPSTIRYLAAYMHNGATKKGDVKRFRQREVFSIWPDFKLDSHITRSRATIKAGAARTSFRAEGGGIVWAVVDSGIAGDHWHFKRHGNLDLSGYDNAIRHMDFTTDAPDLKGMSKAAREKAIAKEAASALTDDFGHGTHVSGIIAGEYITDEHNGWDGVGFAPKTDLVFKNDAFVYYRRRTEQDVEEFYKKRRSYLSGMSPKTKLVSFKVLDENGAGEVSNIIAALAQIQEINEYGRYLRIHGVNLSVGYPFNPEWFACGKSPLCVEVDRLVKSGVVVVVSAGNSGFGTKHTMMTRKVRAGMLMTINDPGNARHAITVGSTHSEKPHEYGPSFFSSKGPTGDGRLKPDLLAPGERIISCAAGERAKETGHGQYKDRLYVDQSGTSMAAPHVSGAIAAFLSVRGEFIGQPERVKEIFVNSATDLGRDRNMQGSGLLDLMRAIQSV